MTVHLGYGRWRAGHVGNGIGFDAYGLRTSGALWHDWGAEIRKVPGRHEISTTQDHHIMDSSHEMEARAADIGASDAKHRGVSQESAR